MVPRPSRELPVYRSTSVIAVMTCCLSRPFHLNGTAAGTAKRRRGARHPQRDALFGAGIQVFALGVECMVDVPRRDVRFTCLVVLYKIPVSACWPPMATIIRRYKLHGKWVACGPVAALSWWQRDTGCYLETSSYPRCGFSQCVRVGLGNDTPYPYLLTVWGCVVY